MANMKGAENVKNMQNGKNTLLPPKIPFPSITPSYTDFGSTATLGSKAVSKGRDGNVGLQRTSSESLINEQPCWLDELLNEPDTPVRKGHRRSSSDSFAYIDASNMSRIDYMSISHDESKFNPMVSSQLWGSQNLDLSNNFYRKQNNTAWQLESTPTTHPNSLPSSRNNGFSRNSGSYAALLEADLVPSTAAERQDYGNSGSRDYSRTSTENNDGSHAKSSSENDSKRAKQQFAQRSRVRKLQYIAELERNVQALEVEGSEFSAELEFINQQNVILSMENKALKQRLESLAQEKLIKYLEHEVLERERSRLRALYQQHQKQPPTQRPSSSSHRRSNSRDLDSQFVNLSLKHKEPSSGSDSITGPLRI